LGLNKRAQTEKKGLVAKKMHGGGTHAEREGFSSPVKRRQIELERNSKGRNPSSNRIRVFGKKKKEGVRECQNR